MKVTKFLFMGLAVLFAASCSNDDVAPSDVLTPKESGLRNAVVCYVQHTVHPTYAGMADAAIRLRDLCQAIRDRHAAGTLVPGDVEAAGKAWEEARRNWELSEAFLYGPAANHNIDPHIDSWPLDKAAMDNLLEQIRSGNSWSLENNGGYGLIGFHAVEYMLFELSADGNASQAHGTDYTPEELEYLVAVANDLCEQCVCLEACWAGMGNVSAEKQGILEDAELDYGEDYGWEMMNARQAGSRFKTYQEAAEEIIQGCIDIADEVGNTKIGRPHIGSSDEDRNYIESPYSLNSIKDFADNIRSVQNAYLGSRPGDASVSDYVKGVSPETDAAVRKAIDEAIGAIEAIPEPFAKNAKGHLAEIAMKAAGTTLVAALEDANAAITGRK